DHLVSAIIPADAAPRAQNENSAASQPRPQPPSFKALSESSNVLKVTLGGEDYKLFLQPFQLSNVRPGSGNDGKLIICGLWRTERLDFERFAVPYSYVIWFGLICVAGGSFVWPFLKIKYRGRTERLRRSDGWLLVFSMFLGIASITFMVLNASYSTEAQST